MPEVRVLVQLSGDKRFKLSCQLSPDMTEHFRRSDQNQTVDDYPERAFKIGRDYSFSLRYRLEF